MKHQINIVFVQSVEEFKYKLIYQKVMRQEYYQTSHHVNFDKKKSHHVNAF